jgi:hypothetical protein
MKENIVYFSLLNRKVNRMIKINSWRWLWWNPEYASWAMDEL